MRTFARVVVLSSTLLLTSTVGCTRYVKVHEAVIATPNVQIEAADGSFHWQTGVGFDPSPHIKGIVVRPDYTPTSSHHAEAWWRSDDSVLHEVWVTVGDERLHGKLCMFEVPDDVLGPISRGYQMSLPQNYVDAARDGRVSVIYETYSYPYYSEAQIAWVLWICDRAF